MSARTGRFRSLDGNAPPDLLVQKRPGGILADLFDSSAGSGVPSQTVLWRIGCTMLSRSHALCEADRRIPAPRAFPTSSWPGHPGADLTRYPVARQVRAMSTWFPARVAGFEAASLASSATALEPQWREAEKRKSNRARLPIGWTSDRRPENDSSTTCAEELSRKRQLFRDPVRGTLRRQRAAGFRFGLSPNRSSTGSATAIPASITLIA